jgi:hypothetical protein
MTSDMILIYYIILDNYHEVCTVKADLSKVPTSACHGSSGVYYELTADIIMLFGATELKAQIAWMEDVSH